MQNLRAAQLLIAPPAIPDPRFRNSVVMMTHRTHSGDFGLCVNRISPHTLQDVVEPLGLDPVPAIPIYWGGPVGLGTIWMLHDSGWSIDQTIPINHEWSMTSHEDLFPALANGYEPLPYRIISGYSAWAPDQLEHELEGHPPWTHRHSWLIAENLGPEWLLGQDPDQLWESATTLSAHQAVDSWL